MNQPNALDNLHAINQCQCPYILFSLSEKKMTAFLGKIKQD